MKDFVFICDTHIMSATSVRSGNVIDDLKRKLEFTVDYCLKNNAVLLHGGDVFDKATVPDYVKSEIAPILMKMGGQIYSVAGNHSRLYDNPEYNYKTSYNVWCSHGVIQDLDAVDGVDFGDCFVTSQIPVITRNKPQIVVYHGFLNLEDGRNTFRFQDLQTEDKVFVCLGHDHGEYEPLQYTDNIKIFRPGSFLRTSRQEHNQRTPKILHIRCDGNKLQYKTVPIEAARPWEEVFKPKELKISKAQQSATYDDIINQIKNAQKTDITFEQALRQVTEPDVVECCLQILQESKLNNEFKAK